MHFEINLKLEPTFKFYMISMNILNNVHESMFLEIIDIEMNF